LKDLIESLSLMGKLPKIFLFVVSVADIANLYVGLSDGVKEVLADLKKKVINLAEDLLVES
jgi:hypothetical protein